jgi:virginiamycin B lyase
VRLVKIPTPGARPYGIALDSKGRPFFNEFGTARLGTLDPATLALKEYPLPEGTRGRRIAITSDDKVWYVDYGRGKLARLDPASGKVDEWAAPSGDQSLPYAMAGDDRDRLWFVETGPQPNRLVGFDPKTSTYFANTPIAGGAGTVRHMVFVRAGRELWFGTDKNTIGRARIP